MCLHDKHNEQSVAPKWNAETGIDSASALSMNAEMRSWASAASARGMAVWAKPRDHRGGNAVRPVRRRKPEVTCLRRTRDAGASGM